MNQRVEPKGLAPAFHFVTVKLPDDVWHAAHTYARSQKVKTDTVIAEAVRAYLLGDRE